MIDQCNGFILSIYLKVKVNAICIFNTEHAMENMITYNSCMEIQTYLSELDCGKTDGQKNSIHKHFHTMFKTVENIFIGYWSEIENSYAVQLAVN